MKITIGLLALSIFGIGYSAEALAQGPPPACQSAPNDMSFRAGVASGRALVQQGWSAVNRNCFQLERFASVLVSNVQRLIAPAGSDAYVLCRHSGIVQGVYEEVNAVWLQCEANCCQEGTLIGEMTGELYCNIAISLGGLGVADFLPRLPVTVCPFNIETCCDTRFIGYTQSFVSENGQACLPYTRPPHELAWDQARNNMCIASVPP